MPTKTSYTDEANCSHMNETETWTYYELNEDLDPISVFNELIRKDTAIVVYPTHPLVANPAGLRW